MHALTGTLRLLRLNFRLDRIRFLIWLLVIVGIIAITVPELKNAYSTIEQQVAYAAAVAPSMVTRLLAGAITGPSLGEIMVIETFLIASLAIALMNIFMVTKHVRHREESGQAELIGSMLVGRQANVTAALIQAVIVNSIMSGLLYLVFISAGLPAIGSLAYAIGIGSIGLTFAAVSLVTSQLFESARTANSLAGLIFGVGFLVRGIGDALGTVNPDGVSVSTTWISWLSPLGWATNMQPFHHERWWVLGLFGVLFAALIGIAYYLLSRRDVGSGLIAQKAGRAHAQPGLLKEFGLIWRLNRVAFVAWLVACIVLGATLGGVANEFQSLIEGNEEMQNLLASYGQSSDPADLMFSATFTVSGIVLAAYGLQLLLRMRAEETSGRLELTLSGPISRLRWFLRSTFFAATTAAAILLATGVAAGFFYGLVDGGVLEKTLRMGGAIMVHAPAMFVVMGCGLLAFALLPRKASLISWGVLGGCLLILQLGTILGLPQWVINLSPFTHTPPAPASEIALQPLYTLTFVALSFLIISALSFRRRDLITE